MDYDYKQSQGQSKAQREESLSSLAQDLPATSQVSQGPSHTAYGRRTALSHLGAVSVLGLIGCGGSEQSKPLAAGC